MIGYLCATPFHIAAAITMQSGMFADQPSVLIVMNHFDVDQDLLERIDSTGVFDTVLLFDSNNKTKLNRLKRLAGAFVPSKLMRQLAYQTAFTHFVCFALDFLNLAYLIKAYKRRGLHCEFSFGDDGVGTYIREGIYQPKDFVGRLLWLTGRATALDEVKRVYAYKPDFMVANRRYELCPIEQSEAACCKRREALCAIWPVHEDLRINEGLLYFEQPNAQDVGGADLEREKQALRAAHELLHTPIIVKMHPRSIAENEWRNYDILKTKMPYEVMVLQQLCSPSVLMTVNSTALFSTYLFDDLQVSSCPSILLYRMMAHQNSALTEAMNVLCEKINQSQSKQCVFCPVTMEEFHALLQTIKT